MKYALVTGGTKGIGRAYTLRLLNEGYFVIAVFHSDIDAAEKFNLSLPKTQQQNLMMMRLDMSEPSQITYLKEAVDMVTETIDVLILNVGYTDRTPFPDITQESWQKGIDTNLTVPLMVIQSLYESLVNGGNIIFTGSLMGIFPHSMSLVYGVTKAAVKALVENLVKFVADKKIRVNYIAPGFIETEWQKEKPKEIRASIESKIALGSFGAPEHVADAMMFIVNNDYMNGHCLTIDGGYNYK